MTDIVIRLLNMSLSAGCAALIVLLLRLLIRKLPKGYSYALWFVVLFRFLCPVTIPSPLSLLPVYSEPMNQDIVYQQKPEIETGVIWVDQAVNQVLEDNLSAQDVASVNPMQIALFVFRVLWEGGMLILALVYMAGSIRLHRRLLSAVEVEPGIYESGQITGAFVTGILRPRVYLPTGLDEESRRFIVSHENVHIRRRDYLVKLAGLCMVTLHWFNPLAWVAFRLLCKDMEMACDEQVLKDLGQEERKHYSMALLCAAERQSGLLPTAFGESHTRSRIRNILNYKRPRFWVTVVMTAVLVVAGIGLVTSPEQKAGMEQTVAQVTSIIGGADGPTSVFIAGKTGEGQDSFEEMPDSDWLASTKIRRIFPGEDEKGKVTIDLATENSVIFHGEFGLFAFEKEQDTWKMAMHVDGTDAAAIRAAFETVSAGEKLESKDSIHPQDKLMTEEPFKYSSKSVTEYDAFKMADGKIAVLAGIVQGQESGRLMDLCYLYYDPADQIVHQVYLFAGKGTELVNPGGRIAQRQYLFSRDRYDYFLRTPQDALDFEQADGRMWEDVARINGRMELVRSRDGEEELLEQLMCMQGLLEQQKVILTEERIVYTGAAEADQQSFKQPGLVSIALDGSDRRAADILYQVYDGLSYAGGYLYYQGWSNEAALPRPVVRMTPDFEQTEALGQMDKSLITVRDQVAYVYDWDRNTVLVCGTKDLAKSGNEAGVRYDRPGDHARHHRVLTERDDNGILTVTLEAVSEEYENEQYYLRVPAGR